MTIENTAQFQAEYGAGRKRPRRLWMVIAALVLVAAGVAGFVTLRGRGGAPEGGEGSGTGPQAVAAAAAAAAPANAEKQEGEEKEKEKAPVPVAVAAVERGSISSYISATANLVPENEVKVLGETEGRVAQLLVDEGSWVRKGQVLAQLARQDAEIVFKKAQLKERNAALAYERSAKMKAESLISEEAFDKLTMDNDISRQELAEAEWRLEKTTIRSPFDGRVTLRKVQLGQHVRPGDELFTVADFDPLVAYIYLPEREVIGLEAGREVRITLKADESTRFAGRIRQLAPTVDPATGTVKVTVEAVAPPTSVRPGGFVTIDVVRETRPAAMLLPREAVLRELQSAHVFVASGEKAEKRTVELGLEEGERVEVITGVAAGEQVVVAGQGGLKDGSPIKVQAAEPQPAETRAAAERPGP
jgi:membrane fusion protein (multidrug efflux system)